MARLEIADGQLTIHIEGWDRVWALKSTLRVPLEHVRGAEARPAMPKAFDWTYLRMPGTNLPGVIRAGSYLHIGDGWYFFDVRDPEQRIAVDLADERYKRFVVQVDGETPDEAAARIRTAIGARGEPNRRA